MKWEKSRFSVEMHRRILGLSRVFLLFLVLLCDLIVAWTVVTRSFLLHPKTIRTHRSSFQQNLIFALKSSFAVQAVGLSCSVYSGVQNSFILSGRMPVVVRGAGSIHRILVCHARCRGWYRGRWNRGVRREIGDEVTKL